MKTKLIIANWNQIVDARSDFDNLRIVVSQYQNNDSLVGTKISIVDKNTQDVYFTAFPSVINSTLIPQSCSMEPSEIIDIINTYGFDVEYVQPEYVTDNVISILQGLYDLGYRYLYRLYYREFMGNMFFSQTYKTGFEKYGVCVSGKLNDIQLSLLLDTSPNFIPEEFEFVLFGNVYPIKNILDTGYVVN